MPRRQCVPEVFWGTGREKVACPVLHSSSITQGKKSKNTHTKGAALSAVAATSFQIGGLVEPCQSQTRAGIGPRAHVEKKSIDRKKRWPPIACAGSLSCPVVSHLCSREKCQAKSLLVVSGRGRPMARKKKTNEGESTNAPVHGTKKARVRTAARLLAGQKEHGRLNGQKNQNPRRPGAPYHSVWAPPTRAKGGKKRGGPDKGGGGTSLACAHKPTPNHVERRQRTHTHTHTQKEKRRWDVRTQDRHYSP